MSTPQDGDLVRVRGLHWVVTAARTTGQSEGETLVDLMSVADGNYGRTLRIVWEIEPDRRLLRTETLPDVAGEFDHPATVAAFLDAIRWSAVTSADNTRLQAPFRSGVKIESYQLEPVSRALRAARVNLLLADDVGLGKTIEAGLVAQELLLRHRVRTVMVVAPAGLTTKWREEMAEKFGLGFTIVDSALLRDLRQTHGLAANPFQVFRYTIVSLSWLRGARAQRLLNEGVDRPLDLLIVDEAHHVAPAAPQRLRIMDSQQTKVMRELARRFQHRLFLTATPHNGYTESFTALLEILDPHRFVCGILPDPEVLDEVMVRRLKSSIRDSDGTRRFPGRNPQAIVVHYSQDELRVHEWLIAYVGQRRKRSVQASRSARPVDLVALILKKRLFSSPAAFDETVQAHRASLERFSAAEDDEFDWIDELFDDDESPEELENDAFARIGGTLPDLTREERDLLDRMGSWARTNRARPDAKAKALFDYILGICCPGGRAWSRERIVIFTEYRATLDWLFELLRQQGLTADGRIAVLHGDTPPEQRLYLREVFQADPSRDPLRVLLATDVAGEGIDLQRHCYRMINYDIPFNPNKLEQRIGRIDRYGQKRVSEIYHFVGAGWEQAPPGSYIRDLEFLSRIALKVAKMTRDMGAVNPVLATAVQDQMLGRRLDIDLEEEDGQGEGDPPETGVTEQVRRLSVQLNRSIGELRITPSNVQRVVHTALEFAHQQPLIALGGARFELPVLTQAWARASAGIEDRLTGQPRPVTFDPDVAEVGKDDVVLAHLGHPLVAMSVGLLRASMWGGRTLRRVTAVISDDERLLAPVAVVFSRLVLIGGDGTRLHEEIIHVGLRMDHHHPQALDPVMIADILGHALEQPRSRQVAPVIQARLRRTWPQMVASLREHIHQRSITRKAALVLRLDERRDEEISQTDALYDRLTQCLLRALDGEEDRHESLADGHRQEKLRRRLSAVERERSHDVRAIDDRYHVIRHHVFPAALVFVVPEWEASR